MSKLTYNNITYTRSENESVLDVLHAHAVPVPSSCRSGLCQTCLMQAVKGTPPEAAQKGLKDTLKAQNYFLACSCHPDEDLEVTLPNTDTARLKATVNSIEKLCDDIVGVTLHPVGDCFYASGKPEQAMLLTGTGSGLAPLYGIARDAIAQGHSGPIKLYHGSTSLDGLYLMHELRQLAEKHENFSYVPCVSDEQTGSENITQGHVLDVALSDHAKLTGWRVFLCGNPNMVKAARKKTFLTGASMKDIYSDAFIPAS